MADGDSNLLVGDEVFKLQLGALVHNLRAPRVAILVAHLFQFLHDDCAQLFLAGQDRLVLGNPFANLLQLFQQFVDGKLRKAVELQFENGVNLAEGETLFLVRQPLAIEVEDNVFALAPCVQILARLNARTGSANRAVSQRRIVGIVGRSLRRLWDRECGEPPER